MEPALHIAYSRSSEYRRYVYQFLFLANYGSRLTGR